MVLHIADEDEKSCLFSLKEDTAIRASLRRATVSDFKETSTEITAPRLRHSLGWRQASLFAGALLGGSIAGAGGVSYAAIVFGSVNWSPGHHLERLQRRIHAALDSVGATTLQEDKVHDIIASGFTSLGNDRDAHRAMRKQLLDLLRSPTIDRAAVEKLRADQVAKFDAKTKAFTGMILDAADQLSPEQRSALADRAEAMMAHGPGGWHKWHRDGNGGPNDDGKHGQGPDGGDDHGSDGNPG